MNFATQIVEAVKEAMFKPEYVKRGLVTTGRVFWVMNIADAGYEKFVDEHPAYTNEAGGVVDAVYTTLVLAFAAMTTNRNDVCVFAAHGSFSAALLTVDKNRCHFLGADGGGRMNSQGTKLVTPATSVAASVAVIKNTGTRNTFRNIKFIQNGTNAAQTSGFIEEGEGTYMKNCEMEVNSILSTVTQGLLFAGDACHYEDCQIGNATVYHTAQNQAPLTFKKSNGAYPRYSYFINCTIIQYTSQTNSPCIYCPEDDAVIGFIMFKNVTLIHAKLGDGATAGGVMAAGVRASLDSGYLLFDINCNAFNMALFEESDTCILHAGPAAAGNSAAKGGLAVASA